MPRHTPHVGTVWRLKRRPDEFYIIVAIANAKEGNPDYIKSVVFTDVYGQIFSRVIDDWETSYEEITDHFNFYEAEFLKAQAMNVEVMIDGLARNFRAARVNAVERKRDASQKRS